MTWLDRQSFLGVDSDAVLAGVTIGVVGLGGGGSHVVQQLAHLGIGGFILIDDDVITLTNLNRLVGGTLADVCAGCLKVDIAERVIRAINPAARIDAHAARWEAVGDALKACDVIVGGVDSLVAKAELEAFSRRFMIPYIDMGMDVHRLGDSDRYLVAGQVVLSSPGGPCLRCLGLVTDDGLQVEARKYGDAGAKPQVVWPNGVLASTAVGLVVQLVTPWHCAPARTAHLVYDANQGVIGPSDYLRRRPDLVCIHYPARAVGDPTFDVRRFIEAVERSEAGTLAPSFLARYWRRLSSGISGFLARLRESL